MTVRAGWFEDMLADTELLRHYPGYAGVVARMDPIATTAVPVAAVALRRWHDPPRASSCCSTSTTSPRARTCASRCCCTKSRLLLGHLTNSSFHAVRHPRAMEVAMEISADEPIAELVPDHGFSIAAFARFGIHAGQSAQAAIA